VITLLLLIANTRYVSLLFCSKHFSRNTRLGANSIKFAATVAHENVRSLAMLVQQ